MKEFEAIYDWFPFCLLVLLPVFIAIAPMPAEAAHEFNVHRMTHLDLLGNNIGSKIATLSMEARPISASHVIRKVVVAKIKDVSVSRYNDLQSSGCGALLLLVPSADQELSASERENVHVLEEHLRTSSETDLPVFYAYESAELIELLETLEADGGEEGAKKSATQTLMDNIFSNGYQLVNAAPAPKPNPEQGVLSLATALNGAGEPDTLPTVLIVAHTDTAAAAPGMATGADSNGSGVGILMELARLWGAMYRSSKTQPKYNVAFLLSGGGKVNYYGSKRFLEDIKETSNSQASLSSFLHTENLQFVVCLDSLGLGDSINMHVSKPPKADMPAARFYADMKRLAGKFNVNVDMVHKKINLAQSVLAWEHEHYSINKHSAFTLSRLADPAYNERNSLLDRQVNPESMAKNTRLVAETMACTLYGLTGDNCVGNVFDGAMSAGLKESLQAWSDALTHTPRGTPLLATPIPKDSTKKLTKKQQSKLHPALRTLNQALQSYTGEEVRQIVAQVDREPDYKFYDQQEPIVTNAYRVKPAVFDLVLTVCIAAYLGVVYLGMQKVHLLLALLASFVPAASAAAEVSPKRSPVHKNGSSNGNGIHNGKVKAH